MSDAVFTAGEMLAFLLGALAASVAAVLVALVVVWRETR